MEQVDEIVSGWLSGDEGYDSPAGSLYIEGTVATEAALTDPAAGNMAVTISSCSFSGIRCNAICVCC